MPKLMDLLDVALRETPSMHIESIEDGARSRLANLLAPASMPEISLGFYMTSNKAMNGLAEIVDTIQSNDPDHRPQDRPGHGPT